MTAHQQNRADSGAKLRVLLAGGGSGGSCAPVLAVAQELLRRRQCEFIYVGTSDGPEREMVAGLGIPFRTIRTGKLRRYWSMQNFLDLIRVPIGLAQSLAIVNGFRPHVAFAAGGFAAVPPLLAASLLRVPTVIHQQDVEPGLANRIIAPFATAVTVTFPGSIAHFPRSKTQVAGNPVRSEILRGSRQEGMKLFGLEEGQPVVLMMGGGTGALRLNHLIAQAAPALTPICQILHITGRGKRVPGPEREPRYRQLEFLAEGMGHALAVADLVVSRAGLSSLTELSSLGKPAILIPMPRSHQNANAATFSLGGAAEVLEEDGLDGDQLAQKVLELLGDRDRLAAMSARSRALMSPLAETRLADQLEVVARGKATG